MSIENHRLAGLIHKDVMNYVRALLYGDAITGIELDRQIENKIRSYGGVPSFIGYNGYKYSSCISVNDCAVHGVPNDKFIKFGDLVSIDVGVSINGFHVDAAQTMVCGHEYNELSTLNELHCLSIIDCLCPGISLFDIIQESERTKKGRMNIFPYFCGHGIGTKVHQNPCIYFSKEILKTISEETLKSTLLKEGDLICIEPVATFGSTEYYVGTDGWSYITKDGSLVAHHEHTVLITEDGSEILC